MTYQSNLFGSLIPSNYTLDLTDRLTGRPEASDIAVPESPETLAIQRRGLLTGKRHVMAFKEGETPLPLPNGFERTRIGRDTYDFNPKVYTKGDIANLVSNNKIGQALRLGPITKEEAVRRQREGEAPVAITERTPRGTEVRAAFGTVGTAAKQLAHFQRTRASGNTVQLELPSQVIVARLKASGKLGA